MRGEFSIPFFGRVDLLRYWVLVRKRWSAWKLWTRDGTPTQRQSTSCSRRSKPQWNRGDVDGLSGRVIGARRNSHFSGGNGVSRGWDGVLARGTRRATESRRDGPVGILGFGVSLLGAGRRARSWPMALEA